jgi:MscS family membrane protein
VDSGDGTVFATREAGDDPAGHAGIMTTIRRTRALSWLSTSAVALGLCFVAPALPNTAEAQEPAAASAQSAAAATKTSEKDPLGRDTPRGTVRGFMSAARSGQDERALQYLRTTATGTAAERRAHQLFVVLDVRLPARIGEITDSPEGSRTNPLVADQEVIAVIEGIDGGLPIVLDRVKRGNGPPVWLFSDETLEAIPELYNVITLGQGDATLPRFLTSTRVGGVRLLEWLCVLLGLPVLYLVTVFLNRILTPFAGRMWRAARRQTDTGPTLLPVPVRLLIVAVTILWVRSVVPLPLLVREFWSTVSDVIIIAAVVWLLIVLNGAIERSLRRRIPRLNLAGATSIVRLGRRVADLLMVLIGVLAMIRLFGVDPTPALAGLGVGGIAVALAAQKTLENVVAGVSLIFDEAVRVGDSLKMGDIVGTVEQIGLRSTRIRTLDRTLVSIPNSQIANASVETLSARDKFWFRPVVGLRYDTTPEQLRAVLNGVRQLLHDHPAVETESIRVRFFRLGPFSLDIEVFVYLLAHDWNHFMELQERLLLSITEIVRAAGTAIAFPSQTLYVTDTHAERAIERPTVTR